MTLVFAVAILVAGAVIAAPGDLVLPRKSGGTSSESIPPSIFQHWNHRIQYRCDACHNRLFEMKLGASNVTMQAMSEGKFCGACHDGTRAFKTQLDSCNRCHRLPAD